MPFEKIEIEVYFDCQYTREELEKYLAWKFGNRASIEDDNPLEKEHEDFPSCNIRLTS